MFMLHYNKYTLLQSSAIKKRLSLQEECYVSVGIFYPSRINHRILYYLSDIYNFLLL